MGIVSAAPGAAVPTQVRRPKFGTKKEPPKKSTVCISHPLINSSLPTPTLLPTHPELNPSFGPEC